MGEPIKKAELARFRRNLEGDLRRVEKRTDARFVGVDKRFAQIDKRFDQIDRRFDQVDRRFDEADKKTDSIAKELHRVAVDVESVKDDVKKIAEGLAGLTTTVRAYVRQNEGDHARLDHAILAGDAALDKRVTALEQRAQS